ncbi:MAG: hypothetical protein PVJ58_05125, partial [Chromatiales bacterium]
MTTISKFLSLLVAASLLVTAPLVARELASEENFNSEFGYDQKALPGAKPWTSAEFQNDPDEFQFVVIGDRTGGANVQETFKLAVGQLNLLQPEFVINV